MNRLPRKQQQAAHIYIYGKIYDKVTQFQQRQGQYNSLSHVSQTIPTDANSNSKPPITRGIVPTHGGHIQRRHLTTWCL